jgi:predicted N-acetyltransferase YhbS
LKFRGGLAEDRIVNIRRIDPAERPTVSMPLQEYGFLASPLSEDDLEELRSSLRYYEGNLSLVAEEGGVAVADASGIPMQQNIRGTVYPMAGVAGVAAHPLARRRGYVRALLVELLGRMRDEGHVVSALHPFRPSFYEKFGYVVVPKARTVSFSPADLSGLLPAELPGEVSCERLPSGYDGYRDFTCRLLPERHGFALLPAYQAAQVRDSVQWLATARVDGEIVGAVTYRITGHGGELLADDLLTTSPLGRALLLRFLAHHVDQISRVQLDVAPDEAPELWHTDLATTTEARVSFPAAPAPMARLLSLDALTGMPAGPGRVVVEIVDDMFIGGRYELDGTRGTLHVARAPAGSAGTTLTVAGLSGLVYGVLSPGDIVVRGFGAVPSDAVGELSMLFPRLSPYFFAHF